MQRKLTFLACLCFCTCCFAQQYPFVYYTPKDGLVNSRVRSIKQDSKGRMLFLTFGGLSVYDGTRFINYNREDGLADDLINDIVEVAPDSFLIATNAPKLNALVRGKIGVYKTTDGFYPVINHCFAQTTSPPSTQNRFAVASLHLSNAKCQGIDHWMGSQRSCIRDLQTQEWLCGTACA